MRGAPTGSAIETKLQVIELSLLPPNSKGIMPAGTQRFPFEFPIPASLPTSVYIKERLEIFYQMSATLRRSTQSDNHQHNDTSVNPINWIDWARRNTLFKKKYTACSPLRIVRAMESSVSNGLPTPATTTTSPTTNTPALSPTLGSIEEPEQESVTTPANEQNVLPWNRRGLDAYQGTYDEQHDQLAFSFAGRSSGNLNQPLHTLGGVQGIRYKIGVDRTAIALGTSIGVELMIEPVCEDAVIKSVLLKVSESRRYAMKVPAGHTWDRSGPETKKNNEAVTMVLKWAYGYQVEDEEDESRVHKQSNKASSSKKGERYLRQRVENSQYLAYFDPPRPGGPEGKQFLNSTFDKKKKSNDNNSMMHLQEHEASSSTANRDMLNLKELNQPIKVGEYFGGRFVVPMPDCSNILHPSMEYESIKMSHWLQLIVTIECNGKTFDLLLDSPARILDCRLVADDESQTVLPPPPSYQPGDGHLYHENNWSQSTFWEQREPITFVSGWGSCVPCPCEYKKLKAMNNTKKPPTSISNNSNNNNTIADDSCPSSHLPEWGPPPCYSEN